MRRSYKLTQAQFEYIVEQADAVLREYADNINVTGIAWLHVLNSHPANQVKYVHVFNKRNVSQSVKIFFARMLAIAADLFLSIFTFSKTTNAYKNTPSHTNVVIISHLVDASVKKNAPDFYFRELPEYLQSHGIQTTVALLNHTKGFKGWNVQGGISKTDPVKCLIPRRLGFLTELAIVKQSFTSYIFFLKRALSEKEVVRRSFLTELARNTFSADTLRAFRIYRTIQYIINHTNNQVLAFTWEGHSWERLCCHAAKTAQRKIVSIAYQHTTLFPSSHALKRSIGNDYDPDVILTVGAVTRDIIQSAVSEKILVKEYGSPRLTAKAGYSVDGPVRNACLVAPEGLINECIILFTFGIEAARLLPDVDFIFRTHPSVHFRDLQTIDIRLQQLPSNVILSDRKKIEEDFDRCSWLLYRSSSVVFFSVLYGLRPLYLRMENELSNDPLFMLNTWRLILHEASQLVDVIDSDKQMLPGERSDRIKDAIAFCERYMMPYNMSVFQDLVNTAINKN